MFGHWPEPFLAAGAGYVCFPREGWGFNSSILLAVLCLGLSPFLSAIADVYFQVKRFIADHDRYIVGDINGNVKCILRSKGMKEPDAGSLSAVR